MTPSNILSAMADAYASCVSYRDIGTVVTRFISDVPGQARPFALGESHYEGLVMGRIELLLIFAMATLGMAAAPPPKADPAVAAEMKKLEGRWQLLKRETRDSTWDARDYEAKEIRTIKGGEWVHPSHNFKARITALDPVGKTFDQVYTLSGGFTITYEAIYRLDGDTLTICLRQGVGNRPTSFGRPTETWTMLQVYKRAKPER